MKKKLLVAAIASALVSPTAFAAEGADGMTYTSASEGFYGTLRVRYDTGGVEDDEATLGGNTAFSRVGVRGTTDMGNGLTGTYQWEARVWNGQGGATGTRQLNVGIDGGFGSVKFGSQNDNMLDLYGRTDVTNSVSGWFTRYRVDNSAIYRTPDLNGFTGSLRANLGDSSVAGETGDAVTARDLNLDGDTEDLGERRAVVANTGTPGTVDDRAVEEWAATANYSVAGLTASLGYQVTADGLAGSGSVITDDGASNNVNTLTDNVYTSIDAEDQTYWGMGLDYSQDNWNVAVFYTEREQRSFTYTLPVANGAGALTTPGAVVESDMEDQTELSISGNVTVGKTSVQAFTETRENVGGESGVDDTYSGVGVQYAFSTQSRVWMDYLSQDLDSSTSEDDKVVIGLRHDF